MRKFYKHLYLKYPRCLNLNDVCYTFFDKRVNDLCEYPPPPSPKSLLLQSFTGDRYNRIDHKFPFSR